jgi:protein SCO1/2
MLPKTARLTRSLHSIALLLMAVALVGCHRTPEPPAVATVLPSPRDLPDFVLRGGDGSFAKAQLRGHPTLVFFGFTHCPELCPTTLTTLASAQRLLSDLPASEQPRVLFISVDPKRDSPSELAAYSAHFGEMVDAVSGDTANLDRVTAAFGAYYTVPADADPTRGYAVEHAAQVYLLDREGRYIAVFSPPHTAAVIAGDIRRIWTLSGARP